MFGLLGAGVAQTVRIEPPADRLAAPGEFITLVFRLRADSGVTVEVEAVSANSWRILRQPGRIELAGGRVQPVAVTLAVPPDALALASDTVTLGVDVRPGGPDERLEASVVVGVSEVLDLLLEAPGTATLEEGGIPVTVTNRGNVGSAADLELRLGGEPVASRALTLAPQSRERVDLPIEAPGIYELILRDERGEQRRNVRVVQFGIPEPEPLLLLGTLEGGVDSSGGPLGSLSLAGPLSDFITLEARLTSELEGTFVDLAAERWTAHLGDDTPRPYRLDLPTDPGVQLSYLEESWGVTTALGRVEGDRFSGYLAGLYGESGWQVAGGVGLQAGGVLASGRGEADVDDLTLAGSLDLRSSTLDAGASVQWTRPSDGVTASARLGLTRGFGSEASVRIEGRASSLSDELYAELGLPIGAEATWDWRVGGGLNLLSNLPGRSRALFQVGARTSFALTQTRVDLGSGWQTQLGFGVVRNDVGTGLDFSTRWSAIQGESNSFQVDGDLIYYPSLNDLRGRVNARFQTQLDTLGLLVSGGWDVTESTVQLGADAIWQEGDWQLRASLGGRYATDAAENPFGLDLSLSAGYAFGFTTPEPVVALAGGRRLGRLEGVVRAGETPLAGVQIVVERFRLQSDDAGRFGAELAPGTYTVRVDVASLPVTYSLFDAVEVEVEIEVQEVATVTFDAVETALLEGRVLQDSDADGTPDEPPVGVAARLTLLEANGIVRSLQTDRDGRFQARGLRPGRVDLRLIEQPFGNVTVGESARTLTLAAGVTETVTFLSRPASAAARSFSGGALRIARIELERERVPPGAAPLVRVQVRGEPDRVTVTLADATVTLEGVDEQWTGRLEVPASAAPGVLTLSVVAGAGDEEVTRRGQLVVDPDAPLFETETTGPARPGQALPVTVTALFEAAGVSVVSPFGERVDLAETAGEPGRWRGVLAVPDDAEDAVYTLRVELVDATGRRIEDEVRFRVLVGED